MNTAHLLHEGWQFGGDKFYSNFFMATGFHGFHVIIGTIFLSVCLIRALNGHFHPRKARRLRGRGLVLALRGRGLAVPVLRRLHLGRLQALMRRLRGLTNRTQTRNHARRADLRAPLPFEPEPGAAMRPHRFSC